MRPTRLFQALAIVGLLLSSAACGKRGPNLQQLSADELYGRAEAQFQAGEYGRAVTLYEAFVARFPGDARNPEVRLRLGQANLRRRDYVTAATHFQQLVSDYPTSPLQLDARFGICQSYYELSPRPALDQEYTHSALIHCESIGQYYPGTPQAETASGYAGELRTKLARKAYETGLFYFRRKAYDAAVVYFEDAAARFPQTEVAPQALAQLAETYGIIGYVEEAQEARERLLRDYPNSPQAQAVRAQAGPAEAGR